MSGHSPRILDQEEFRAAWNAEPLIARNRIARAVDECETMPDPEDAALAAAYARDLKQQKTKAMRWMSAMTVLVAIAIATGPEVPQWTKLVVFAGVFGSAVLEFRGRHRYDEIAASNEAVVHAYWAERRPLPPASGTIAEVVERWREQAVGESE